MRTILSAILASALALAATSAFAAGGYIQASSEQDQIATDTKGKMITLNSTDAAKGLKNANGVITLDQTGTYFTIVGVQVGSRGGTGLVRIWFQTNGKDADNTNCEQMIPDKDFTTVMISQGVGEFKKGDKITMMYSGSAPGIGLVFRKPAGEPAIPSVIFSAWKID